ncbi:MAG TPA: SDR family oxidoreductase [Thermoplasmata archaeon]|nr:SDR family oxidoreductase [Thermoplasmata archaeon]
MSDRSPRPLAVVTGASRGLGEVLARFLAGEGYDLVVVARGAARLAEVADRLRLLGVDAVEVAGDVGDPATRARIAAVVGPRARLDLLVNNASELGPSPLRPLSEVPLAALEQIYRTNVVAPVALVQTLRPWLAAAPGRVINISSDAAIEGYAGWGAYGASKAALDLVTRTLARELAVDGISVVSVDPGDMRTAMHQAAFPGEDISDRPLPDVTVPFFAWLLHEDPRRLSGARFRAQAERWEVPA